MQGLKTVATRTLTPTTNGRHVRMEQSGFGREEEANDQGAAYGWWKYLGGLERAARRLKGP